MKVNVSKMKQEISKLNTLEEYYEDIYLTYYNIIPDIQHEWNNEYEKRLMKNVDDEKKQMNMIYNNLKEINLLYSYICNKYSFCNGIKVDFNKKEIIIKKIDNCIMHLKKISNICNNLDTRNMNGNKTGLFNDTKYKINLELDKLLIVRKKINDMFDKIEGIENDIRTKISEFTIGTINETDIFDCIEPF